MWLILQSEELFKKRILSKNVSSRVPRIPRMLMENRITHFKVPLRRPSFSVFNNNNILSKLKAVH